MDREDFFQRNINALFGRALAVSGLAGELGLTGFGERWEGPGGTDRPGWYLWLAERPGAYELLLAGFGEAGPGSGWATGRFLIRYFPRRGEAVFAGFGPGERALIEGGLIGPEGVPRIAEQFRFDDGAFAVGMAELALSPNGEAARIEISAVDRLKSWRESGVRPERDVPALELAHPLLPVLAGVVAVGLVADLRTIHAFDAPGFGFRGNRGAMEPAVDDTARLATIGVTLATGSAELPEPACPDVEEGARSIFHWHAPAPPSALPEPWTLPPVCFSPATTLHRPSASHCNCCMG